MTTMKELEEEIGALKSALATASGAVPDAVTAVVDEPGTPAVGDLVHVLQPLAIDGQVRNRGETFEITEAVLQGTRDRDGRSSLAGLIQRGILGRGDFESTGLNPWSAPGDPQWSRLYVEARARARSIHDPIERQKAEAALKRRFGDVPNDWNEPPQPHRSKWSY